eukprot:gene11963-16012_t
MNCQSIGDPIDATNEGDVITALEYDSSGQYLAAGDRSGRITILKNMGENQEQKSTVSALKCLILISSSKLNFLNKQKNQESWSPYFQFQSHDPEFDFLKSLEIESKINQIKFCQPIANNQFLLSTNDKTIKLWKVGSKKSFSPRAVNSIGNGKLLFPESAANSKNNSSAGSIMHAYQKKVYANAHTYHINSLALNSDRESFVSADDLRINWWNFGVSDTSFNIVDIKPENMEELTEVITAVQFHPSHCNILVYSSSRGAIKVCDTRSSALCHRYAKVYTEPQSNSTTKSFITDILNSISDINFSADERYIVSRDYLTVKLWDVNMESRPVKTVALHDYLRPLLYDLYTSDIIFDKFEVCCSPDGKNIATGSYSNQLKVYYQEKRCVRTIDLPATPECNTPSNLSKSMEKVKMKDSELRLDEKVLHCAWHPSNNTVAVAGKTGLCLYRA